jgi:hypothetical protein
VVLANARSWGTETRRANDRDVMARSFTKVGVALCHAAG